MASETPNEVLECPSRTVDVKNAAGLKKLQELIDDEVGQIAVEALASGAADPAEAKKVSRKIDTHLLPFPCITYGATEATINSGFITLTAIFYTRPEQAGRPSV
ncbi:MAG: hypothetical protein M1834_006910 [Cirrosporium novae-zelandiae]|nr:MAG: hypothetical protein M1834_006910 [Cirrosporium novae-zelandiae]